MNLHRILYVLFVAVFNALCFTANAQCNAGIQYTVGAQSLYNFTYTTTSPDPVRNTTWYFSGPYISDVAYSASPSYYLTVNGTYFVTVELEFDFCRAYHTDTIQVTGSDSSGTCNADFTYYPTTGGQFQFTSLSSASDSIISYFWYALTPDSFLQANGMGKRNPEISLWNYNCMYPTYQVTHAVTTVSGCRAVKVDTIKTYCTSCISGLQPGFTVDFNAGTNTYSFHDASVNGNGAGNWYWSISLADDSLITSTLQNPVVSNPPLPVVRFCLEVYDTVFYCRKGKCDSISNLLSNGPAITADEQWRLQPTQLSATQLQVNCNLTGQLLLTVYDITGKCMLQKQQYNYGPFFMVETPAWLPGVYLVAVQKGDVRLSAKLLWGLR